MRTAPIKLRQYVENEGSLAMSVWLLPDFSIAYQKQIHEEYDLACMKGTQPFVKPDTAARMVLAAGGRRRLDTVDGRPHFGDVWEERGFVYVQIGDGEDFEFSEADQWGKGQTVQSSGNWLVIPRSEFLTTKPYTLKTPIPGIAIVNDILEVTPPATLRRDPVDRGWIPHHSITFDIASSGLGSATSSVSVNHTMGTGSNRHMFSCASWNVNTETAVSCVWNTTESATSLGGTTATSRRIEDYSLVAPTEGALAMVMTISGTTDFLRLINTSRFGVHQTTPVRTFFTFTSEATTTPSITVTDSQNTDMVVDHIMDAGSTLTVDASQTQRENTAAPAKSASSEELATGANTVMSWTVSASTSIVMGAVALVAAPSGFGRPLAGSRNNPIGLV